jgi:hypothetical protein
VRHQVCASVCLTEAAGAQCPPFCVTSHLNLIVNLFLNRCQEVSVSDSTVESQYVRNHDKQHSLINNLNRNKCKGNVNGTEVVESFLMLRKVGEEFTCKDIFHRVALS